MRSIPALRSGDSLLEVRDVVTELRTSRGAIRPVNGVSFSLEAGKMLAVVGESGCGKSMLAYSLMGLLPPNGRIAAGSINLAGTNLAALDRSELDRIRGRDIAMIFQEPMTSLNPVLTVGIQVAEVLEWHRGLNRREALDIAVQMFRRVGIPEPEKRIYEYPHQLSGGMRQRALIAAALACEPKVLIADEPTTALDVTIQAQVMKLLDDLRKQMGMAVVLITHDLGVVSECSDMVAIMYAGRIVEYGPTADVLRAPTHPYTRGLLASVPRLSNFARGTKARLTTIPGAVPPLFKLPSGCSFSPRCDRAFAPCANVMPVLRRVGPVDVSCHAVAETA